MFSSEFKIITRSFKYIENKFYKILFTKNDFIKNLVLVKINYVNEKYTIF